MRFVPTPLSLLTPKPDQADTNLKNTELDVIFLPPSRLPSLASKARGVRQIESEINDWRTYKEVFIRESADSISKVVT